MDKIIHDLTYLMFNQCYCCWVKWKFVKNQVLYFVLCMYQKLPYLQYLISFSLCFLGSCPWSEVFLLLKSRFSSPNNQWLPCLCTHRGKCTWSVSYATALIVMCPCRSQIVACLNLCKKLCRCFSWVYGLKWYLCTLSSKAKRQKMQLKVIPLK